MARIDDKNKRIAPTLREFSHQFKRLGGARFAVLTVMESIQVCCPFGAGRRHSNAFVTCAISIIPSSQDASYQ
jgi:hypothetical protein